MSVYIDVWHRTHPFTQQAHTQFLDYYGEFVVAPPSNFFEVVAGFRYLDGPLGEDFALYRYASMAAIEESMMSFGADARFIEATAATFSELDIEETRAIALHTPYAPESRLDAALAAATGTKGEGQSESAACFVRIVRTCSGTARAKAFETLSQYRDAVEAEGTAELILAFHYIVGPVMDLVEIWKLPPVRAGALDVGPGVSQELRLEVARWAPARERRALAPTAFSALR